MYDSFYFKGSLYNKGSIVQVYKEYKKDFNFYSHLIFERYDDKNGICYFRSLYSCWERYEISVSQLNNIIENVTPAYKSEKKKSSTKVEEKYIEGIVSAWIWYIIIMFFGLFLKGPENVILTWTVASFIFFYWRHKKMNGE